MITCPKCNFDNELGRIFCHQCGSKLDLDKIKAPTQGAKMRRQAAVGTRKIIRTGIELAIAGGVIFGIWLVCVVPDFRPIKPTNAELVSADIKRLDLGQLVSGRKPGVMEVTEGELNTFLNTLGLEKPKAAGIVFAPVMARADFSDGTVKVSYLGELRLGTAVRKQFCFGLAGTPTAGQGTFMFKPTGAWIGRLPIHPKLIELTGFYQSYFASFFAELDNERKSLDKLSSIAVTHEKAVLTYQPAAAK